MRRSGAVGTTQGRRWRARLHDRRRERPVAAAVAPMAVPLEAVVDPTPEVDALDESFRRPKLHDVVEGLLRSCSIVPA